MPLSDPAPRTPWHLRNVELRGYLRDDGLYDVEARLVDTKTYAFDNHDRGRVRPGEPVHDMAIRLTIDEGFLVHAVEAVTDAGPYRVCPGVTPNFKRLEGLTIGPGFRRRVYERLGGIQGCTHLVELVGAMATAAYQTLAPLRLASDGRGDPACRPPAKPPAAINSCHAYRADGEVVKRLWPAFYTGADAGTPD